MTTALVNVPTLPPGTWFGRNNKSPAFVKHRLTGLNEYLGEVMKTPDLAVSAPMLIFLEAMADSSPAGGAAMAIVDGSLTLDRSMQLMQPGDLILFLTPGVGPFFQRLALNGHFDHVGIVSRSPAVPESTNPRHLKLLESTMDGRCMNSGH